MQQPRQPRQAPIKALQQRCDDSRVAPNPQAVRRPGARAGLAVLCLLACLIPAVHGAPAATAADTPAAAAARVQRLAAPCLACHGQDELRLDGNVPVPRINGQREKYLRAALEAYRRGTRDHPVMRAQVAALTPPDLNALATWFSDNDYQKRTSDTPPPPPKTHPAQLAAVCGGCHAETGIGNMPEYPVLSGQHADYLRQALEQYRNGKRRHAFMPGIARALSQAEIDELSTYFGSQSSQRSVKPAVSATARALARIEMADLPGGNYEMGRDDPRFLLDGRPRIEVTLAPFRIARTAVTFEQYDAFALETKRPFPPDEGWGRDGRPVINVSWADTQAFIAWISAKTGRKFRLPSEAEREYATAAGTTTAWYWGDKMDPEYANARGVRGRDRWAYTAPVGQFAPNAFGLFDMSGNVWERTADCWAPTYVGQPADGRARATPDCISHTIRGGYWDTPGNATATRSRAAAADAFAGSALGFRLAETP